VSGPRGLFDGSEYDREKYRWGDQRTRPGGYRCDEVSSALQKAIRRGEEELALFFASELDLAGYGGYVWKRLRIIASEDVGLADPQAVLLVRTLYENWLDQREADRDRWSPASRLFLVNAVLALARAKKSRLVDHALVVVYQGERPQPEIPDYALDMHTKAGRAMGRGAEHFYEEGAVLEPKTELDDTYYEVARMIDCGPPRVRS
jgi:replication-associated recombination protein RarA